MCVGGREERGGEWLNECVWMEAKVNDNMSVGVCEKDRERDKCVRE